MNPAVPCLSLLVLGACAVAPPSTAPPTAWNGRIESWGTLREALHDGQVEGRVALADVARPGVYGVGALAGLRGEITIADGDVWVCEATAQRAVTTRGATSAALATVLFAAEVGQWRDVVVDEDVDPADLDAFVAARAREAGLDVTRPFPFLVEGGLRRLDLHVIAGACPIRARMLGGETPPGTFELHSAEVRGRLVGIYAPDSTGVVCSMGSQSHVHALLDQDGGLTGHVESVGLARGCVLRLPLRGPGAAAGPAPTGGELTQREREALQAALDDEQRAWATYDQVLTDFGEVRPFSNVREAEARHIAALTRLFERYGLTPPANPWTGEVPRFASLSEACRAAVTVEIENVALYDRLLADTRREDLLSVFRNLREASQERHLPAFRRCAERR